MSHISMNGWLVRNGDPLIHPDPLDQSLPRGLQAQESLRRAAPDCDLEKATEPTVSCVHLRDDRAFLRVTCSGKALQMRKGYHKDMGTAALSVHTQPCPQMPTLQQLGPATDLTAPLLIS